MPALKSWTVDELAALPDDGNRHEIVDGELLVTPSPSLDHQVAVSEILGILGAYCSGEGVGVAVVAPSDVIFSRTSVVQPDVYVLALVDGRRPRTVDAKGLLLTVEVLSPGTARVDRVAKRRLYRRQNVAEYWIIDLDARTFERSTPADERVDVFSEIIAWRPDVTKDALSIDLTQFFARVLDG